MTSAAILAGGQDRRFGGRELLANVNTPAEFDELAAVSGHER